MVVCQPSPEDSESEHVGGSTVLPEWQLLDWDDVERVEETAVEQIHLPQCWMAYLAR